MSRSDGIDELADPAPPIARDTRCPESWRAMRGFWSHSSGFAMAESERAGKQAAQPLPPVDDDPLVVEFVPRPREYPELHEDELAAAYLAEPLPPLPEETVA